MSHTSRFVLEAFTAPICDGGGRALGVIDTAGATGIYDTRYVATFSQGWERSAQTYVDGLNAEDAEMNARAELAQEERYTALMAR